MTQLLFPTIFIDVAVRVAVFIDFAVRARIIIGVDIAIRIGVSVQAGNFTVEVGRIPTNFIQDNQHYIFILIVILVSGYTRIRSFATITFCSRKRMGTQDIKRHWAVGLLIAIRGAIIVDVTVRTRATNRIDIAIRIGASVQAGNRTAEVGRIISTISIPKGT